MRRKLTSNGPRFNLKIIAPVIVVGTEKSVASSSNVCDRASEMTLAVLASIPNLVPVAAFPQRVLTVAKLAFDE